MINLFRIYLSHFVRGANRDEATTKEIEINIAKYIAIGTEIKAYLIDWEKMDGFPKMELYVPAEHAEFVEAAKDKKYLAEKQILDVDCEIIDKCSLLIACGDYAQSRGMTIEIQHAEGRGIPIYYMPTHSEATIKLLKHSIKLILEGD